MAYREGAPSTACSRHPSAPAAAACFRCEQPICEICIVFTGEQPHCHACAKRMRARGRLVRAAIAVAALALVGAGGFFFLTRRKPFDYGGAKPYIYGLKDRLDREPCDRSATLELATAQIDATDLRGAIDSAERFFGKCGDWPRLRWITFAAHEHLNEHAAAVGEATRLIADNPSDQDFWYWRAQAYESMGKLGEAAADFRQALAILPDDEVLPGRLADVDEKLGRYCEALAPLEQLVHYHPDLRDGLLLRERMARLSSAGKCARRDGTGHASLKKWDAPHALDGRVTLGSGFHGSFAIDPDAAYVVITARTAAALSLDLAHAPSVKIDSDEQLLPARLTTLPLVSLDGATALAVEAAVVDALPGGLDGRLGASFFSRFTTTLDEDAHTLDLEERAQR